MCKRDFLLVKIVYGKEGLVRPTDNFFVRICHMKIDAIASQPIRI
jgi:hypothetical protein